MKLVAAGRTVSPQAPYGHELTNYAELHHSTESSSIGRTSKER